LICVLPSRILHISAARAMSKSSCTAQKREQEELDNGGDPSDNETMTSDRTTSSRCAASRGRTRREQKRLAYLEDAKKKALASGLEWKEPLPKEEFKKQQTVGMLYTASSSEDGIIVSAAASKDQTTIEDLLLKADENKMTREESLKSGQWLSTSSVQSTTQSPSIRRQLSVSAQGLSQMTSASSATRTQQTGTLPASRIHQRLKRWLQRTSRLASACPRGGS